MKAASKNTWESVGILDGEGLEPLFDGYVLWSGRRIGVRRSDHMALMANVALFEQGRIGPAVAMMNEMTMFAIGWVWADRVPARDDDDPEKYQRGIGI